LDADLFIYSDSLLIYGYNFVVSPDVKGKFSMKLIDVPWDQALEVILEIMVFQRQLKGISSDSSYFVIAKEEEEIARQKNRRKIR
jgi:type IV pilus assembly protein PilQ